MDSLLDESLKTDNLEAIRDFFWGGWGWREALAQCLLFFWSNTEENSFQIISKFFAFQMQILVSVFLCNVTVCMCTAQRGSHLSQVCVCSGHQNEYIENKVEH